MSSEYRPTPNDDFDDDDGMPVYGQGGLGDPEEPARRPRPRRTGGNVSDFTDLSRYGVRFALVLILLGFVTASLVLLFNGPLSTRTPAPTPTLVVADGSLIVFPTFTPGPAPTPLPSVTPSPDAEAPGDDQNPVPIEGAPIATGATVVIANTSNQGANLRQEATTESEIVQLLTEGTQLSVLAGPEEADGFNWWQVQLADDNTQVGWVAAPFLQVVAPE